jgi:hypothetical protein
MNDLKEKMQTALAPRSSASMREEIETKRARRAAMNGEMAQLERQLETARAGLIEGAGGAMEAVTQAQARFFALREAMTALDANIAALCEASTRAEETEAREGVVTRLAELTADGAAHFAEMIAAREEAGAAMGPFIDRMIAAQSGLVACRAAFIETAQREAQGFTHNESMAVQLRQTARLEEIAAARRLMVEVQDAGADLEPMAVQWAGTPATIIDDESPFGWQWPPAKFGQAVTTAFQGEIADRKNAR